MATALLLPTGAAPSLNPTKTPSPGKR